MSIEDIVRSRFEYNIKILNELYSVVGKYPELRFGQIIEVFCNPKEGPNLFAAEPSVTYKYLQEKIKEYDEKYNASKKI